MPIHGFQREPEPQQRHEGGLERIRTTFSQLLLSKNTPDDKEFILKFGRYHQHLHELLDMDISAIDYMMKMFPELKERDEVRKIIGRYGITGKQQVRLS